MPRANLSLLHFAEKARHANYQEISLRALRRTTESRADFYVSSFGGEHFLESGSTTEKLESRIMTIQPNASEKCHRAALAAAAMAERFELAFEARSHH
jgi:hypothetical protein